MGKKSVPSDYYNCTHAHTQKNTVYYANMLFIELGLSGARLFQRVQIVWIAFTNFHLSKLHVRVYVALSERTLCATGQKNIIPIISPAFYIYMPAYHTSFIH